ncbi:MAG: Nramp family divalent metal transporter [Balneolaceae bacterium]|nr:Nramp family divalent metal transporter [Balneolaceae bacterium]MBO6546866.1 Nramp family divalent metal transporter [Balneolaceae bacterium]MBO6649226.1 Nramp family divalent metal transporter [Balneolaceae bacterium]
MKNMLSKYFGPSTLVTAAFIGPGTVTVCTLAGVRSGYMLLWAILFSVIATIVLQEMTARLGLVTQKGFGEAIRKELTHPIARFLGIVLVLGAIVFGNAAYEGGNISGAVLGFEELFFNLGTHINGIYISASPLIIGAIAFCLLITGSFRLIERFLIGLVLVMSLVFLTTAFVTGPDLAEVVRGLLIPSVSSEQMLTVIALIGTTVVPYNLFLHASIVQKKYKDVDQLSDLRKENATAIILGGIISMSIVITSATTLFGDRTINSAADMAIQLEPLLGSWSGYFLGLGLFAAGISSAITAPLAAAYAAKGILGWEEGLGSKRFKVVWMGILFIGVLFSMFGISPVQVIQFAQVANGILLPLIAIFLLYLVNKKSLLGSYINSVTQNVLGLIVILVAILISFRSLNSVFGFL